MTRADSSHMEWTFAEWERWLRAEPVTAGGVFTSAELGGLEEPVQRHLSHAIRIGTPLAQGARLTMRGSIKIGRWLPFRARQILRPLSGFIWAARVAGVMTGSDRYRNGVGGMDWKLAGLVPLMYAQGPDVSRSAAGRGGAEAIWLPTALLPRFGVNWTVEDESHIRARYRIDNTPIDLGCRIGPTGQLLSLVFDRWGDPDQNGRWDWYPFGGTFSRYRTVAGLTVPSAGRFGWNYGTDRAQSGEFFRFEILDIEPDFTTLL